MKNVIWMTALLCCWGMLAKAQTNISCYARETCEWDVETDKVDNCVTQEESSLFQFNEDETMVIHTTESIKSAYYIKSKEKNEETGTWMFEVVSDVGNKYLFLVNLEDEQMKIAYELKEEYYIINFKIKHMWVDE